MKIRAITLGIDHQNHVDAVLKWAREKIAEDYRINRVRIISADVESVHIKSKDVYKLQQEYLCKEPMMVLKYDKTVKKQPFPGVLMCGDGVEWMLVIQFPIFRNKNQDFVYQYNELRQCEIDFLADMPVWTGLAVEQDQIDIHDTIERVYGVKIHMPGTLSIGALFIANGFNMPFRNMVTVNLFVMGGTLNKVVSEAENQWWNNWEDLPDALKIYCVGDIRFGYTNATVLLAHLMESYFPDPVFMCMITQETLTDLKTFILDYILQTLMRTDGKPTAEVKSRLSPQGIADCLREWKLTRPFVATKRDMVTRTDPRIMEFVKLIPPWMMVCEGGCRSGIQARAHALIQMEILAGGEFHRNNFPLTLKITRGNIKDYPDFRAGPEHTQVLERTGVFQAPSSVRGLSYPDELQAPVREPVLAMLEQEIQFQFLARVLDYVTKFPGELRRILNAFAALESKLSVDSKWLRYSRLYHSLRDMHVLLHGPPPPMCQMMWDLKETIRLRIVRDLAPIRGGFAEETIRELANPDNMSNIQLGKLVTDIVPGRNKKKKRNRKAREARLRQRFGEDYVRQTDRQRAAQRKVPLEEVRSFILSKKRSLEDNVQVSSPKKKRKTTLQENRERSGRARGNPGPAAESTVTSGELQKELEAGDLRFKVINALVPQAEAGYDKSSRKKSGRGSGGGRGSQNMELEYTRMTAEEKADYLKTAMPAGWGLEFMASEVKEDDLPLQIHWDDCQETFDV